MFYSRYDYKTINSLKSSFKSKYSDVFTTVRLILSSSSNVKQIDPYILWIYDPFTKSAYADLRAGLAIGNFELEITANAKDTKGTQLSNPKTIQYTTYDLDYLVSGTVDGGTA